MRFSVIIPIFNVAKFIERGIENLRGQTFQDFEVILVDDGSTDHSGKLCDDAAVRDNRIKVLHQKNSGSGPARNAGIEIAQGDYILFFDIDDILKSNAFEVVDRNLQRVKADILIFSYREINPFYNTVNEYRFTAAHYQSNQDLRNGWVTNLSGVKFNNGFVWNKAYKRDFLIKNHIRFEPLRIQQDEVFNLLAYKSAEKVYVINDVLYNYYVYNQGNTGNRVVPERLEIFIRVHKAYHDLMSFWGIKDNKLDSFINKRLFLGLITHVYKDLHYNFLSDWNKRSELRRLFNHEIIKSVVTKIDPSEISFVQRQYYKAVKSNSPIGFALIMAMDKTCISLKGKLRQWK